MCKSVILSMLTALLLSGCASTPRDLSSMREHRPRSVLVIPPINESTDLKATYAVLSTVTRPLAEKGYYVFPVAVIDQFLKENGMPTPGEMNQIPLHKIHEIIGADAVLFLVVNEYGTKYTVLDSSTIVHMTARLVDVKSGDLLWSGRVRLQASSSAGSSGLVGMMITAAVDQVISHSTDEAHDVVDDANRQLLTSRQKGLLYGPYHPQYGTD